ncbi:MAG: hypothetical protein IJ641_07905 [Lachnospiraceae bacterium]|nr:hypothetical protein [Lachnospiraceae bacterium]
MAALIDNWYLIIAAAAVIAIAGYAVYVFIKRPTSEQIKSIKEWLIYATVEAEKALGSGTGQLKLRYVYNMFIDKFPQLSSIITFSMFSGLVDEALSDMKRLLETNKAVTEYTEV